ncbi:MAG: FkbM family methyltransferase [Planctomycetota bacterium]
MADQVRFSDHLLRIVGTSKLLPRKIRAGILVSLAGPEKQKPGRDFEVTSFGKFYLGNTSSHVDWHVFFFGEYDPVGIRFLRFVAEKTNPVFLDIGANTGTHSLAIANHCKEIHCFEPNPKALTPLRININRNLGLKICVHDFGLSDQNSVLEFYENKSGNLGAGTFEKRRGAADQKLEVKIGDEVVSSLGLKNVDLIKLDTEGHEFSILKGITKTLSTYRPILLWELAGTISTDTIAFEFLFPENYLHFRLSHRSRWKRQNPRLYSLKQNRGRNIVSIPEEQFLLVENLVSSNA